ncbi:hypothetical protein Golax_022584 [Gossypium laxum]|uniref:Cardiolipin synthase n=1 Tax=Gossypium laxum TaxID=34288 RepID=A0A7J9B4G8_9ROSI|nr:hypothetical protein [Gossypium laxum]
MRINSVVGSYLDPLADKVLIGCVALSMVHNHLLHTGLVGLVVFRDVALVSGAVYQRASSLGWQVNTVFQLILVASALLQPEFGTVETQSCITYLSWLVAVTTVGSTFAYGAQHMRKRPGSMTRKH